MAANFPECWTLACKHRHMLRVDLINQHMHDKLQSLHSGCAVLASQAGKRMLSYRYVIQKKSDRSPACGVSQARRLARARARGS